MMKSALQFSSEKKMTYGTPKVYKCDGEQCKACKLLIANAFLKANDEDFSAMSDIVAELSIDTDESWCFRNHSKFRNVNRAIGNISGQELLLHFKEFINVLKSKSKLRKRRDSEEPKKKLLGTAITISCNYKKGTEIAEGWCGLCNLCWQWRKLPNDYFPAFLNEVSCDANNEGCISVFGKCRPVMRAINVLRNLGTRESPRWIQESINTMSACECQVQAGSPLHSLISR